MATLNDLNNPVHQAQVAGKLYGLDKLSALITNSKLLGGLDFASPVGQGSNFSFKVLRQLDYTVEDYDVGGTPVAVAFKDFEFLRYDIVLSEQKNLGPIAVEKVNTNSVLKGGIDKVVSEVTREFTSDFMKDRADKLFKQAISVANAYNSSTAYEQMINIGSVAGVIDLTSLEVAKKARDAISTLMSIDNQLVVEIYEDDIVFYGNMKLTTKLSDPGLNITGLANIWYEDGSSNFTKFYNVEYVRWNKVSRGGDIANGYNLEGLITVRGSLGAPERMVDILATPLESNPQFMLRGTSIRGWNQWNIFTIAPELIITLYTGAVTNIPVPAFPYLPTSLTNATGSKTHTSNSDEVEKIFNKAVNSNQPKSNKTSDKKDV